jgi:hypothetical protein
MKTLSLLQGIIVMKSQMTPLDLLMRMRKKRSASELVLSSKKISGIEVELYTKEKESTLLYQFVSYRI